MLKLHYAFGEDPTVIEEFETYQNVIDRIGELADQCMEQSFLIRIYGSDDILIQEAKK